MRRAAKILAVMVALLGSATAGPIGVGTVVRELTDTERAGAQQVRFPIHVRHLDELRDRVGKGEVLTLAELEARYFPTAESWSRVASWARSQGFAVLPMDATHMTVVATAPIATVERALRTHFARVLGTDGQEYTSAVSRYTVPAQISDAVGAVFGLHPGRKPIPAWTTADQGWVNPPQLTGPYQIDVSVGPYQTNGENDLGGAMPATAVAQLYNAVGLGYDGSGETVVVVGWSFPALSDLTTYWSKCGLPTTAAQYTVATPASGDQAPSPTADASENTLDVEMVTTMAPGAKVILLSVAGYSPDIILGWLMYGEFNGNVALGGAPAMDPTIHEITISEGLTEWTIGYVSEQEQLDEDQVDSQYYAVIASMGISVFAASGDDGSTDTGVTAPYYPASDPSVTGVGGTFVDLTQVGTVNFPIYGGLAVLGPPVREGAWTFNGASGGGLSVEFKRPSWQANIGIAGNMRAVPDVSACAGGPRGIFYYYEGGDIPTGGTSASAPMWAGICALINQARREAGLGPIGVLGPHIYPLMGTPAFNDIVLGPPPGWAGNEMVPWTTTATNGNYTVGPGFDLVTGIGSPNVGVLLPALASTAISGFVLSAPPAQVTSGSTVAMSTTAVSNLGTVSYQWLHNGVSITGATGASFAIPIALAADGGTYSVMLSDGHSTSTLPVGTLNVTPGMGYIANLSSRALVAPGGLLTTGFIIGGSGGGTLPVLARGIGPSLAGFNVPNPLTAVSLTLFDNATQGRLATNAGWPAELTGLMASVGAFALQPGSLDAALAPSLAAGAYSSGVSGPAGATGVALNEIYDAGPTPGPSGLRLTNVSTLAETSPGSGVLTAGFVVGGGAGAAETVLIRGVGPGLSAFSVSGPLAQPQLTVFDSQSIPIVTDTGWSNPPTAGTSALLGSGDGSGVRYSLAAAETMANAGAFALAPGSADCALILTLPPGSYSAQVSGVGGASGQALIEIYELE